ncbi:hypothetical protein JAAARDRAFT_640952 [Jaapia argillacea MUCL 33604]|uniref:RNase III domain-containing protein n=1 Tax=Jaapia argillacea MUCL 33604 TaxID=933084 RepID=A0A067PGF5_9AGAM|nr:hypothetical protein JAAARDRAFT_640952 [Jaapia argillacea MUCL 33604]
MTKACDRRIQHAILDAIESIPHHCSIPALELTPISDLCHETVENERIEFVGDSLLQVCLSLDLYTYLDTVSTHVCSVLRSQLVSNVTLAHLAGKLALPTISNAPEVLHLSANLFSSLGSEGKESTNSILVGRAYNKAHGRGLLKDIKRMANVFETFLGILFFEQGFSAVQLWLRQIYKPLISIAARALHDL